MSSNVLPNDSDPEDDTLTVKTVEGQEDKVGTAVTLPSGATVTLTSDGAYTFDPSGQYESLGNGDEATESFAYTISDGHGGTDEATVTVAITGVNDSPITKDEGLESVVVGSEEEHMDDVLSNVKDMEEDELTVTSVNGESGNVGEEITLPSGASVTLQEDGSYTYDPAGDFESLPHGESASDTFEYTVSDGNGGTLMSTLTLVVHGENNGPRAADDSESTTEDAAVSSNVLPNDSDPEDDTLTVKTVEGQEDKVGTAVTLPSGATVTLTSDGAYIFDRAASTRALATATRRRRALRTPSRTATEARTRRQ